MRVHMPERAEKRLCGLRLAVHKLGFRASMVRFRGSVDGWLAGFRL